MIKRTFLALLISTGAFAIGEIENFHPISEQIFRSAAPGKNAPHLIQAGFSHVLIFKNETKNEVQAEIASLQKLGVSPANIYHIPFRWEKMGTLESSCGEVVQALAVLAQVERTRSKKILFHCTMGEDRTGALAGLYRMVYSQWSVDKAFNEEMCAFGYEAGDKGKPAKVVASVRNELTPVFLAVAALIMQNKISFKNIDPKICTAGGLRSPAFQALLAAQSYRFTCR